MTKPSHNFVTITTEILDMILNITGIVYGICESSIPDMDSKKRDQLNLAALITDNAFIDIATGIFAASWTSKAAKIELGTFGDISIEAESITDVSTISHTQASSPTPAVEKALWVIDVGKFALDLGSFIESIVSFTRGKTADEEPEAEELL